MSSVLGRMHKFYRGCQARATQAARVPHCCALDCATFVQHLPEGRSDNGERLDSRPRLPGSLDPSYLEVEMTE